MLCSQKSERSKNVKKIFWFAAVLSSKFPIKASLLQFIGFGFCSKVASKLPDYYLTTLQSYLLFTAVEKEITSQLWYIKKQGFLV